MRKANHFAIDPDRATIRAVIALSTLCALVLVSLAIVPMDALNGSPAVCPFKRFLGMECYGCGMTRALSAFLHGEIRAAVALNRGVLFTLPCLAALALLPAGIRRKR